MNDSAFPPRVKMEPRRFHSGATCIYREPGGYELKLFIFVGIDRRTARVGEVFCRPGSAAGKESMLQRMLDTTAGAFSESLQRGATPHDLARTAGAGAMGRHFDAASAPGPDELARETRDRGGCAQLEIPLPNFSDPDAGENFRLAVVPLSDPAAALIAACVGVQTWLDAMSDEQRAALRAMLVRALPKAPATGGGEGG